MVVVVEAGAVGNVVVSEEDTMVVIVLHHLPLQFKTNLNSRRSVLSDQIKHIQCLRPVCCYLAVNFRVLFIHNSTYYCATAR
jgi:hypothetical protein